MKIIFLDIDGVLNHQLWFEANRVIANTTMEEYELSMIDESRIELLNDLIESTGAKVVVSSTWRKNNTISSLQKLLDKKGFTGEILSLTPYLSFIGFEGYNTSVPRGCEIKAWLDADEKASEVTDYIILDDDSDMLLCQRENYFRVDGYCGLTPNLIYRAKRFLNKDNS